MPAAAARARPRTARTAYAGISSEAVEKATGKTWEQWLKTLDRAGAKAWPRKQIAEHLHETCGVGEWWCQMVTVGYEQARGLREKHQTAQGFRAQVSKTVDVEVERLFAAWSDARQRNRWLPGARMQVRRETAPKSMRVTWGKSEDLDLNFFAKGDDKSMVQLQHGKLSGAAAVARQKKFWTAALARLKAQLEDA